VAALKARALVPLLLFVLALTGYLYNFRYRYWGAGGDTTPAELLPLTLAGDGDLFFDEFVKPGEPMPFWYTPVRGRAVSSYPILPGFFNVPTYFIAQRLGIPLDGEHRSMLSMITASVVCALSVVFLYLAALHIVRPRTAFGAALVYAFGTTVFSVAARGMWQHGPSVLFLTCALWLLARGRDGGVALAGLLLGFAVFSRPSNLLIAAPLTMYVAVKHSRKTLAAFIGFAAIPATLLFWYSYVHWGSIRNMGQYSINQPGLKLFATDRMGDGLLGLLFNPSRGLLVFTPLFLFSFVTVAALLRRPSRQPLLFTCALSVPAIIVLYSMWYSWWGGSCFGYRLLTELVPILVLTGAWGFDALVHSTALRIAIGVAAALSFYVHFLGAYYAPCGFDSVPNDINKHPERLWSVRDGELARCSSKLFDRISSRLHSTP
jgi:hypothetical protein